MWRAIGLLMVFLAACGGENRPASESSNVEGEVPTSVLTAPGSATHPAVSPDGSRLAFMSNAPGVAVDLPINFEIFVSTTEGSDPVKLTDNQVFDADIAWSPNGGRIAFKSYQDGNDEIYVMNADGSGASNLTQNEHSDFPAALVIGRHATRLRVRPERTGRHLPDECGWQ